LGALLNLPVNMLGGAFLASYGRHHEFESDKFGVQLAAAAGYDPAGLPTMLARMEKEGQLSGHSAGVPSFLNTHPLTPRRLWRCRAQAGKVVRKDIPPIAKGRTEFLQKMAGLLVGESPGLGVFTGGRFLHPDLGFVIEFPEGWRTVNTRAAAGAVSPQKDACIFLGVAGRGAQPKQRAEALAQKMAAAHGLRPDRSEAVTVGPYTGHLLTFSDTTAGDPASMYFLWFGRDDLVFQVIGLATPARLDTLKKTVRSFRSPTPAERDAIQARYLHTAVLRPGEDLERLSKRTGNAWSSAMTHLANGVETGTALQTGSPVKVSVARRYSSLEER
jgi:predicted Zn-dependent protease